MGRESQAVVTQTVSLCLLIELRDVYTKEET